VIVCSGCSIALLHPLEKLILLEAKFNEEDVFFTDLANDHPIPFRIGDLAYWQESGSRWEKQLEYNENLEENLRCKKKPDWLEVARLRWEEDLEAQKKEELQIGFDEKRFPSSQLAFAPQQLQDNIRKEREKKHIHGYYSQAMKMLRNHAHVKYVAPPRGKILF
jgi:hypothetical protein